MKKIIAAAVATAFVAPAFAANVQISGEFEYQYEMKDVDGVSTDAVTNDESTFTISASEELPNGMTVTGKVTYEDAASSDQGVLTFSGAGFGKLSVGDAGGPLDNANEVATGAPEEGGDVGTAADMSIVYMLPTFVDGLTIEAGMSPDAGAASTSSDASGYAVSYTFGGLYAFYGSEEVADADFTGMGIKYSAQGFTVAYETLDADAADAETTGLFGSYKTGNVEFGVETQETETAGTTSFDKSIVYVQYHLGPVDLYVEQASEDVTNTDTTNVGVEYAF